MESRAGDRGKEGIRGHQGCREDLLTGYLSCHCVSSCQSRFPHLRPEPLMYLETSPLYMCQALFHTLRNAANLTLGTVREVGTMFFLLHRWKPEAQRGHTAVGKLGSQCLFF